MTRFLSEISYTMRLDDRCAWNLSATSGAAEWLQLFASALGLRHGNGDVFPQIKFIRGAGDVQPPDDPPWPPDLAEIAALTAQGWKSYRHGLVRFWTPPSGSNRVCELLNSQSHKLDILMMGLALEPVHQKAIELRGVPLHGALLALEGKGVVLVGANDAGKTTCCQRLPERWDVLCDDETLVLRENEGGFFAHPFPTWSDHFQVRSGLRCDVSRRVPLSAIFFLQKSATVQVVPIGKGQAAARISESSGQTSVGRTLGLEAYEKRERRKRLFENACDLAKTLPAFNLRLNLTGNFWEEIEQVLSDSQEVSFPNFPCKLVP